MYKTNNIVYGNRIEHLESEDLQGHCLLNKLEAYQSLE